MKVGDNVKFEYGGVTIVAEKEEPNDHGHSWGAAIYLGECEWHEFEGSGVFNTLEEVLNYMMLIVDRDFPRTDYSQGLDSHDYQRMSPEDVAEHKDFYINAFELEP